MNASNNATAVPVTAPQRTSLEAVAPAVAGFGLIAISALAFAPAVVATPADKITLLFLAVVGLICFWTPLLNIFERQPSAAAFALTAAMFVVYSLARTAGPKDGWALQFKAIPEDKFVISYAARIVVLCAIVAAPTWWRNLNGWIKALLTGALVLALLSAFSFIFLSRSYKVGVVEELDPTALPHMGMQLVEYTALALLCTTITAHPVARRVALRLLPFLLAALWARHYFAAAPPEPVEEEAQ
jgi:hypothetical protein